MPRLAIEQRSGSDKRVSTIHAGECLRKESDALKNETGAVRPIAAIPFVAGGRIRIVDADNAHAYRFIVPGTMLKVADLPGQVPHGFHTGRVQSLDIIKAVLPVSGAGVRLTLGSDAN